MFVRTLFYILFFITVSVTSNAQVRRDSVRAQVLRSVVVKGDTLYISNIPEVTIYPSPSFRGRWDLWRYRRLVYNVKKAYPYAKMAGELLKDVDNRLAQIPTDKERKRYVNKVEDDIRAKFEDEVKKLTITQGRILIKLIDRETGNTTYDVLQTIKGNFSAVFWQAIAKVFGSTLKSEYDPYGEDFLIEQIIMMIDSGQL